MNFVYLLRFQNGKIYIGITTFHEKNHFMNRFRQHKSAAKRGNELPVYNAWRKYGDPVQEILSVYDNRHECELAEIDAIQKYDAMNPDKGYNIASGGQGLKYHNNPKLYELMRQKVWDNPERRKKASDALKGRAPSKAALDSSNEWKKSPEGKAKMALVWADEVRKKKLSIATKMQMANGGSENLRIKFAGRKDPRSDAGKQAQIEKIKAWQATDGGKASSRRGYEAMASNPDTIARSRAGMKKWRESEENALHCKEMAKKSALACNKKVRLADSDIIFNSQKAMAEAMNVSSAAVSLWVKSGKAIRLN